MMKQWKTERISLVLLCAVLGCTKEPQASTSPHKNTTAQAEEDRSRIRDDQKLIVIGQVIGTQGDRVSQTLEQAGIHHIVQGDEFHDISVLERERVKAVDLITKDAQLNGYEIVWKSQ